MVVRTGRTARTDVRFVSLHTRRPRLTLVMWLAWPLGVTIRRGTYAWIVRDKDGGSHVHPRSTQRFLGRRPMIGTRTGHGVS